MNEYLVITWTDSVPVEDGLAKAAREGGGQPLAARAVYVAGEPDSRPAPAGVLIARFSTEETARSWFDAVLELDGTTLLAAGATAPVWWPPEKEPEHPEWSRRGELSAGRVRPIREIQTSSGQRRSPVPGSPAHPGATGLAR
jgi:hypothetical protein